MEERDIETTNCRLRESIKDLYYDIRHLSLIVEKVRVSFHTVLKVLSEKERKLYKKRKKDRI